MFETFKKKQCIWFVASCITFGFFAGCAIAAYRVYTHKYIAYDLYAMAAYTFQHAINHAAVIALLLCILVAGIVALAHILARIKTAPEKCSGRGKLFSVLLLCLVFGGWAVDAAHQKWFYSFDHHLRIFLKYDIAILIGMTLSGWFLMKINLDRLLGRIGKPCMVLAVPVLLLFGLVNGGLYLFEKSAAGGKPNIIFISIDALRRDHVGCYGYPRNTTPNMDAFARDNIVFNHAFVNEPWTLTSHMSMLTGFNSITHGTYEWKALHAAIPTLAEYLKNVGYATIACVNTSWLVPVAGFGRGFDRYSTTTYGYSPDEPVRSGEKQNVRIIGELTRVKRQPFFAFIHYFDVHSKFEYLPYDAPEPFKSMFNADVASTFRFSVPDIFASDYLGYVCQNSIALPEQELQNIVDLYDGGVAYADHCLGEFFSFLKKNDLYDNTMIIVTADHGEEFQEHGWMLHSNPYYYDVILRVPLLVKLPKGAPLPGKATIDSLVEIIDIQPSILDLVGIEPVFVQGKSFLDLISGKGAGKETVYGIASTGSFFVRDHKWKLISDKGLDRNRYRLYDLANDPGEQTNVVLDHPEIEQYLEEKLRKRIGESHGLRTRMTGAHGGSDDAETSTQFKLDEQQKEHLRSLGYVL